MIPCGHNPMRKGCHLCHLYDTVEGYRKLWSEPARGECFHLGVIVQRVGCGCTRKHLRRCNKLKKIVSQDGDCVTCEEYDEL